MQALCAAEPRYEKWGRKIEKIEPMKSVKTIWITMVNFYAILTQ